MAALEPLISVKHVNHYFGEGQLKKQVLFDVSAEIMPGEIVLSTGPSGSGKTTLLTLVGALRTVQEGSLRTMGKELANASRKTTIAVRRSIGFIFQAHNLLDALTASQNVMMSLQLEHKVSGREARARAVEVLGQVGLSHRVDFYPSQLSGGQKQRVAIARALVHKPQIILADEPTAALDKKSGREVVDLLQQLAKEHHTAIMLVTHDNRILDIADRILTLEDGRIVSFTVNAMEQTGHIMSAFTKLHRKGDLTQHVSNLDDEQFLKMLDQVTQEFGQFMKTVELANHIASESIFDEVLEATTLKVRELLNADRATLYFVDRIGGMIRSKVAETEDGEPLKIRIPIGKGIAGKVAESGQPQIVDDAWAHPEFNRDIDERTGYRTRTLLCAPIFNRKNEIFAVAQFLNRKDGQPFTSADVERFTKFAAPLAVILEGCYLLATRPQLTGAEQTWIGGRPMYREATWIGRSTEGTSSGGN